MKYIFHSEWIAAWVMLMSHALSIFNLICPFFNLSYDECAMIVTLAPSSPQWSVTLTWSRLLGHCGITDEPDSKEINVEQTQSVVIVF